MADAGSSLDNTDAADSVMFAASCDVLTSPDNSLCAVDVEIADWSVAVEELLTDSVVAEEVDTADVSTDDELSEAGRIVPEAVLIDGLSMLVASSVLVMDVAADEVIDDSSIALVVSSESVTVAVVAVLLTTTLTDSVALLLSVP